MTDPDPQAALIAAQLRQTIQLLQADIKQARSEVEHYKDLANHRLAELEAARADHEDRIRKLQDSSTQFKVLAGLATSGGIISIINFILSLRP